MRTDKFKQLILNDEDIFTGLYSGKLSSLKNVLVEDEEFVKQYNNAISTNADPLPKLTVYKEPEISIEDFDKSNQRNWFMPKDYYPNLLEYLYELCETPEQTDRVSLELELFIQHNMMDLLFYLKYLVDTMRENKVLWGVGRGSSVASYVLYLIGVHKIDSIKYGLDIHEFLKGEENGKV